MTEKQAALPADDGQRRITLRGDDGEELTLYVLEGTRLGGRDYLLAADSREEDGEFYLLKDVSSPEDTEAVYVPVEDEAEQTYLLDIFRELLDDIELETD